MLPRSVVPAPFLINSSYNLSIVLPCAEMERGFGYRDGGSGDTLKNIQFRRDVCFDDASFGRSSSKSVIAPALPKSMTLVAGKKEKGAAEQGFGHQSYSRCQVEGCNLDLKGAKSYYYRHKVCGMHSKSPKVIVAGLEQRFCQQCSRFHLLKEFDQGKRSCRRRLAGHNERRRKPPPGLLPSHYGMLSSFSEDNCRRGGFLMDFKHHRPADPTRDILWTTMKNGNREATNQLQGRSLQSSERGLNNAHPALYSAPELSHGVCIAGVPDSTCALSLLSTQPWGLGNPSVHKNQHDPTIAPGSEFYTSQPSLSSSYLNCSWPFKDYALGSSTIYETGLRPIQDDGNFQCSGKLEHTLQGSRHCSDDAGPSELYDYLHDLHWPL